MDNLIFIYMITLTMVITCFHYSFSMNCYSCNSHYDKDCGFGGAPLNQSHLIECEGNATNCRKIHQLVPYKQPEGQRGPDERIIRQCGYNKAHNKGRPCYYVTGYGGELEVCACYTDGCNVSSKFGINLISIGALIFISFAAKKFLI